MGHNKPGYFILAPSLSLAALCRCSATPVTQNVGLYLTASCLILDLISLSRCALLLLFASLADAKLRLTSYMKSSSASWKQAGAGRKVLLPRRGRARCAAAAWRNAAATIAGALSWRRLGPVMPRQSPLRRSRSLLSFIAVRAASCLARWRHITWRRNDDRQTRAGGGGLLAWHLCILYLWRRRVSYSGAGRRAAGSRKYV